MKQPSYQSKQADANGHIDYSDEENNTWKTLYQEQIKALEHSACKAFQHGVEYLQLSPDYIPQLNDVNDALLSRTGWQAAPVPALIPFEKFFSLLADKQFPCATFIRRPDELKYLKEPDIFHELFGHCTMLTNPLFADFTQAIGQFGITLNSKDQQLLARLYWFTVEFGLVKTPQGLRVYGGGILSSIEETDYALHSSIPQRLPLDIVTALRMPYRYDEKQLTYFILDSLDDLYTLANPQQLTEALTQAKKMGSFPNPHKLDNTDHRSC